MLQIQKSFVFIEFYQLVRGHCNIPLQYEYNGSLHIPRTSSLNWGDPT